MFYDKVRRHQHRTMVRPEEPSCTLAGFTLLWEPILSYPVYPPVNGTEYFDGNEILTP
jgi:hypothetical protein